jgi:hypothetical protein
LRKIQEEKDRIEAERQRKIQEEKDRIRRAKEEAPYAQLITEYALFIGKMEEFERLAQDPKRLFGSSMKLLQQEKFRKTQFPKLQKMQDHLLSQLQEFETKYHRRMMNGDHDALDDLEYDMHVRFVSQSSVPLNAVAGTPSLSPMDVQRGGGLKPMNLGKISEGRKGQQSKSASRLAGGNRKTLRPRKT